MSRLDALLDYLRRQGPGPDEPDEMDAVQPADPVTVDPPPDYIEQVDTVTIRRGRTYDEPVEGM